MFASAHPYAHFLRVWLTVLALLGAWPAHAAFTDNGDGTVTDTVTLLIWDKCSWGQSGNACATGSASTHSLAAALGVAVTANASFYKGKNDWRLPNARELESLVNLNGSQPATDSTTFPNTQLAGYWSSTIGTHHPGADPTGAVIVDFLNGYTYAFLNIPNHVRLVRSGQSFSSFDSFPAGTSLTPQTINIDTSPTSLVVGGTGTVSATASSGLPVIFSSRTPWLCTVSGNTVTGVGVGLCNVNVDQPGDARYSPAITALALINIVAPTAYTLYVNSIGASGVAIAASPTTYAGISNYGTGMMGGTSLTLTAPSRAGNATFSNWSGCDVTSGVTCALTMLNADRSVTALYNTSSLLSQSITFGAAPSVTVGGTGRVSATATSGLAVTFSSIDTTATCSVSGSTVTGLAAGTCVLTANQSGDARYSPAPPTKQVFNVGASTSLLSQSITFGTAPSVALGGTGTVSATATSGLAVSFSSVTTGICSVSGSTVTGLAAGTCILTANQSGNTRYSPAPQAMQSFNVVASTGYTLTVNSTGASGVAIGASPTTYSGTSNYSKTGIAAGASIILSAPSSAGSATFSNWSGCDATSGSICALTLNASRGVTALYNTSLLSQSITFGTAPGVAVGGTGTVSATATSGLVVSFSSVTTGICSVSGSTVTGLAAGTCILTANQSGDARYSPAPQAMQTFAIAAGSAAPNPPTNITITAGSGSAMLNFSISTDTDGSPITHYTATCSANGQTTRTATGSASPLTVKNLSGNVAYQCSLTATNGSGLTSSASDPLPVTPMPAKKSGLTPILMLLFE
jgi:hypothetical protein